MKILLDFIPLLVFFVAYKSYDIYVATLAIMVVTGLQLAVNWFKYKKIETMQAVTFGLLVVFGSMTLIFHDDTFLKWKVSFVNWLFAIALLVSRYGFGKNILSTLLGKELTLPTVIWDKINLAWASFFVACGAANVYVAFYLPQEVWVNFKVFGLLGLTLLFILGTVFYISRHATDNKS